MYRVGSLSAVPRPQILLLKTDNLLALFRNKPTSSGQINWGRRNTCPAAVADTLGGRREVGVADLVGLARQAFGSDLADEVRVQTRARASL